MQGYFFLSLRHFYVRETFSIFCIRFLPHTCYWERSGAEKPVWWWCHNLGEKVKHEKLWNTEKQVSKKYKTHVSAGTVWHPETAIKQKSNRNTKWILRLPVQSTASGHSGTVSKESLDTGRSAEALAIFSPLNSWLCELSGVAASGHWCSSGCVLLPGLEWTGGTVGMLRLLDYQAAHSSAFWRPGVWLLASLHRLSTISRLTGTHTTWHGARSQCKITL